jgi:hypothetical protein
MMRKLPSIAVGISGINGAVCDRANFNSDHFASSILCLYFLQLWCLGISVLGLGVWNFAGLRRFIRWMQ